MKRRYLTTDSAETVICVSCLTENKQTDAFCRKCGSPIGATTNLNPLGVIQTEGFLLRKALEGRPKLIVLVGVWILFLPVLVISVGSAIYFVLNPRRYSDIIFFGVFLLLAYAAFIILYRVTKNYLTLRKEPQSSPTLHDDEG